MFPHGSADNGTGVPRWTCHRTAPLARSSPYTVSPSVAAITRSPTTRGWP
jgi:hypothetical protein